MQLLKQPPYVWIFLAAMAFGAFIAVSQASTQLPEDHKLLTPPGGGEPIVIPHCDIGRRNNGMCFYTHP
jgi:hypothetical protein